MVIFQRTFYSKDHGRFNKKKTVFMISTLEGKKVRFVLDLE